MLWWLSVKPQALHLSRTEWYSRLIQIVVIRIFLEVIHFPTEREREREKRQKDVLDSWILLYFMLVLLVLYFKLLLLLFLVLWFSFYVSKWKIYIYIYFFAFFSLFGAIVQKTPLDCSYKNIHFFQKSVG